MTKYRSIHACCSVTASIAISLLTVTAQTAAAQGTSNDRWVTVVTQAEPPDLDGCHTSLRHPGRVLKQNIVETLVKRDPKDGLIKPRLAVSWERPAENIWVFRLRQGVTFHDGTPFNAAAVKKSIERSETRAFRCNDRRLIEEVLQEVSILDEYTISITTKRPDPIFPTRMAGVAISGPNTPQDKVALQPIGTGPYVFDSWQAGQQILLKRNNNYWGTKPQAEGVRFIWRAESAVRAAMAGIGEADIAIDVGEHEDINSPAAQTFSTLNASLYLRLDTTLAPLNDKRVRLAMNYALNREGMIGTILSKDTLLAAQIVLPVIPGYNHTIGKNQHPYDPVKAKQLLAEARADGVPVDTEILFITHPASFPNASELMEAFYSMFTSVGLNIKVTTVETGEYARWNAKPFPNPRPPTILQALHDNITGDPFFSVNAKYGCEGINSMYCNLESDNEVEKVTSLSGEERVKGWQGVLANFYENLIPDIPLYHMVAFSRVNKRVSFNLDPSISNEFRAEEITFR